MEKSLFIAKEIMLKYKTRLNRYSMRISWLAYEFFSQPSYIYIYIYIKIRNVHMSCVWHKAYCVSRRSPTNRPFTNRFNWTKGAPVYLRNTTPTFSGFFHYTETYRSMHHPLKPQAQTAHWYDVLLCHNMNGIIKNFNIISSTSYSSHIGLSSKALSFRSLQFPFCYLGFVV